MTHSTDFGGLTVAVVDDDANMRAALGRLFAGAGARVEAFASGKDFLAHFPEGTAVAVLDVMMPGMSGVELQQALRAQQHHVPVVFLSGSSNIPVAVAAMRAGACDFVEKPFDNDDLLARVRTAAETDRRHLELRARRAEFVRRLATLTGRERQVMELVALGRTSKEIARELGTSHRTVEIHRVHVMEKMEAASVADLVRASLSADAGVPR